MKFRSPIPIAEIASRYNLQLVGNYELHAHGINEIHKVKTGDITFVDCDKYYDKSLSSDASIIIIDKEVACPEGKALLIAEKPFEVYDDLVLTHRSFQPLNGKPLVNQNIHDTVIVERNSIIGNNVSIGRNSYIQAGAIIHSDVVIGEDVTIQSGAIIGTDAFYSKRKECNTASGHQVVGLS